MTGRIKTEYSSDLDVIAAHFGISEAEILNILRKKIKGAESSSELLSALQSEIKSMRENVDVTKRTHCRLVHSA
jgi:plasmid stability protein